MGIIYVLNFSQALKLEDPCGLKQLNAKAYGTN